MNDTDLLTINSMIAILQEQRNAALNDVVKLQTEIILLKEELRKLKEVNQDE